MTAVWYIGDSAVRAITPASWAAIGAPGDERVWSAGNGWSIPTTAFTPDQLAYLEAQSEFDTTGEDGPRPSPADPYWTAVDDTPASQAYVQDQLSKALIRDKNLGDLPNPSEAKINLGLGDIGGAGQPRFTGQGPPGTIIGANPGDEYLDKLTGDIYTLQ